MRASPGPETMCSTRTRPSWACNARPEIRLPLVRRRESGVPALAADHRVAVALPHPVGDPEPGPGADHHLRTARLRLAGLERRDVLRPEQIDPVRCRDEIVREFDRRTEDGLEHVGVDPPGEVRDGHAAPIDRPRDAEARALDVRLRLVAEGAHEVGEIGEVAVGVAPLGQPLAAVAVERADRQQRLRAADVAAQDEAPGHGCYATCPP